MKTGHICKIVTDRVRSTTGRLCFDTCLSVCPHLGVPRPGPGGGGYPSQAQLEGYPPARGVPHLRYPHQTWPGGTPAGGYSTLGSPLVRPGQRVPLSGGGGTPPQVTDGVLDMPRSVCLLRSRRRTFLFHINLQICSGMVGCHDNRWNS